MSSFVDLRMCTKKPLEVEDQLWCPEVQVQIGDEDNELKKSFERFQENCDRCLWKQNAKEVLLCIN